jgi:3-oxoacyl-[acyl-carrier protein] reductase
MPSKTVLLIGSSGGLGKHFTIGLAKAGYNLALHYHDKEEELKPLFNSLDDLKIKYMTYSADITSEENVINMIENVCKDFGGIDILINNAGISLDGVTWKLDINSWNKVIGVNLTGPFLCIKHILPIMRKNNWGRIINMSSVVSQVGVPGTAAYSVSKSGLLGLTKTVSKEVSKNNITVNVISLGYFKAGMLYQISEELREQIKQTIPKKEFGEPEEIINCIIYLCSENASYITGQTININGGLF